MKTESQLLTEWYVNDARGLEEGFTLAVPPVERGDGPRGPLALTMAVQTEIDGRFDKKAGAVRFVDSLSRVRLQYAGLKAWDVSGRELPAEIDAGSGQIALLIDDRAAAYPVTIDPLIFTEVKLTASDAAAGDSFGNSVAVSGDTAVVGTSQDADPVARAAAGSAYAFVRSG